MSLMERMSKVGLKSQTLDKSEVYNDRDITTTSVHSLNVMLSGEIDGGFGSGVGILAGPSKHFKSGTGLIMVSDYLKKHKDAICIFYDSEYGTPPGYWDKQGIDSSRVLHVEIENIEELKHDFPQKLAEIKRGDKVIFFTDSIGNLASIKEVTDAMNGDTKQDMTRAKELKSFFRIVTPMIKKRNLPAIFVAHTYNTLEMFSKAVVSGGTGIVYSADWIIIFGRQQEKDGTELTGWNFIMNSEKSRFVHEKSKIPLQVTKENGIEKYSGMLELALESGDVMKPKNGWYQIVDTDTGELVGKAVRESATNSDDFLGVVVKKQHFKDYVRGKYMLSPSEIEEKAAEVVSYDLEGDGTTNYGIHGNY
jgi:hypothetical protein